MKDYIDRVILPYIRFVNPDGKEDYHQTLLVLDDFSAHEFDKIISEFSNNRVLQKIEIRLSNPSLITVSRRFMVF